MHIREYASGDAAPIAGLQSEYGRACPGATVQDADYVAGFYGHPAFEGGRNILCALGDEGNLLGYAFVFPKAPAVGLRDLYVELKARPGLPNADAVRDRLLEAVNARAAEIARATPECTARLQAVVFSFEADHIRYLASRGFAHYESGHMMARNLGEPIPDLPTPQGVEVRPWRMEREAEQMRYLEAHNQAFPNGCWDLATLQYFMGSPMWVVGTSFTAFAGEDVAGSLLAYWNEGENRRTAERVGSTEEVFILAPWRRRGLARCLIARGLAYLRDHGLAEARLELSSTNAAALALYRSMGYRVVREEVFLARDVGE